MIRAASIVLALLASTQAVADQPISKRADMDAGGELDVTNVAGSITVTGWDRAEVLLEGMLWDGAEELIFDADGDRTRIEVRLPDRVRNTKGSRLDIRVPVNTDVLASAVSAEIDVRRISGDVRLQSVSGDVNANISSRDVVIRTVSGDIDMSADGITDSVQVGVVSGDVLLRNINGDLTVEAVSGDVDVLDADLERVNIEAVSGDLDIDLNLNEGGRLDAHTVSGDVLIRLSNLPSLEVLMESFSGDICSLYGVKSARTSRYAPGRELRLEVGSGDTPFRVETLSGTITVRGDGRVSADEVRDLTNRRRSNRYDD